jgi:D-arabinono-1,4-lactone oxidase
MEQLPIERSADGYYHPRTVEEIQQIVRVARARRCTVRVRGSGHSVAQAIYTDNFPYEEAEYFTPSYVLDHYTHNFQTVEVPSEELNLLLDNLTAVTFSDSAMTVTVEAGCHLGIDPYDPTQKSTYFNGLFYQLDQHGWAVPDTGGISHQSLGGFISTGSSGGSVIYNFDDAIEAIAFVDGHGEVRSCSRTSDPDLFHAVGVSMGLLGIITSITLKCIPRYDIIGQESTTTVKECPIDLFGEKGHGLTLEQFLRETEYTRLMWWPQRRVERMVVWQARRMREAEYTRERTRVEDGNVVLQSKHYEEVDWVMGSPLPMTYAGDAFYTLVAEWPHSLRAITTSRFLLPLLRCLITRAFEKIIMPVVLRTYTPVDAKRPEKGPQTFWDSWWCGLPMDNQADDRIIPTEFTELWIPIERAQDVMRVLRDHYARVGVEATGIYACEVYAAKRSPFWMSPSYGQDVIRIDVFWFGKNPEPPYEYYEQFWKLLAPFGFRAHWGKYLPGRPDRPGDVERWRDYLRAQNPRWDDFLAMRERCDPDQVFVTGYWRERFGIAATAGRTVLPAPLDPRIGKEPSHLLHPEITPKLYYAASIIWTLILSYFIEKGATQHWGIFTFDAFRVFGLTIPKDAVEWTIIGIMGIGIGAGVVWFRRCTVVFPIIFAIIGTILLNIVNQIFNGEFWKWSDPFNRITPWWTGFLFENAVAIFTPLISRVIGHLVFPRLTGKRGERRRT